MSTPIKPVSNPRLYLSVLSDDDVSRFHSATLDVIE